VLQKPMKIVLAGAVGLFLFACNGTGNGPVTVPELPCEDAALVKLPRFSVTKHKAAIKIRGVDDSLPGITWAQGDSVQAFFGGKDFKLTFVLNRQLYLVTYTSGKPTLTRISHDDEGINGAKGSINSPLFSSDGKKLVFAGTSRGKPVFILDAVPGNQDAWRFPLDPKAHTTADPHWYSEAGKTFIYFSTLAGLVTYQPNCNQIAGSTYRAEILSDTNAGPIEVTGIRGAYRGGISKDGKWAGTSYATAAIYDREMDTTLILDGGAQQCNSSMNPFPVGSTHMDYMMTLAFGGTYPSIEQDSVSEGLHENLWIYNKDNKIVWQAKLPGTKYYYRWDKPEWSTHPNYATAIASHNAGGGASLGDFVIVKIENLANAEEGKLHQATEYLKIAVGSNNGSFDGETFTHLWVAP
jgi:hypothetical protein